MQGSFQVPENKSYLKTGCLQSLDWTSRLDWWTGLVDWTGGLVDWWTGLVDWWTDTKNYLYAFKRDSLACRAA